MVRSFLRYDIVALNRERSIFRAAANGDEEVLKKYLSDGRIDMNCSDWITGTPLAIAASKGHTAVVKLLLGSEKVDVNRSGWDGYTPLVAAARNGHEAVVKLLLGNDKVDVNGSGWDDHTPLVAAARNGHEAVVKLLLGNDKVDVNAQRQRDSATALLLASQKKHKTIVQMLLADDRISVGVSEYEALILLFIVDAKEAVRTSSTTVLTSEDIAIFRLLYKKCAGFNLPSTRQQQAMVAAHTLLDNSVSYQEGNALPKSTLPSNRNNSYLDKYLDNFSAEVLIFVAFVLQIMQLLILRARRLETKLQKGLSNHLDDLSVFPNRRRPPCTTMPWNIWPALVVLWGVCWMFYNSSSTPFADESHTEFSVGAWEPNLDNLFSGRTKRYPRCFHD
jgi:hypothetical protein